MIRRTLLSLLLTSTVALAERPKLVVLEFTGAGVEGPVLKSVTERTAATLSARGVYDVMSSGDVESLLGIERQKALLGCSETSCLSELSGALGARFVMSGTLARLGDSFQLTLTVLDTTRAQPVGRAVRLANSIDDLLGGIPFAVAQAAGIPPPEEPSKVLPTILIGVGAATLIAGGVVGLQGLTQEASLQGELTGSALDAKSTYEARAAQPAMMKTISLSTMIGGAVVAGLGVLLWPRGIGGSGVAIVPSGTGVAVVGGLP